MGQMLVAFGFSVKEGNWVVVNSMECVYVPIIARLAKIRGARVIGTRMSRDIW